MLLRSVFGKTIRDLRWPTFWAGSAVFLLAFYFTYAFPTYSTAFNLQDLLDKIPPAMKALIGGQLMDVSTVNGFLNIELFPFMLPAILGGYAIAQGSGLTAGEESRGTIDVLLSYPVSRRSLVVQKSTAATIAVIVVATAVWLGAVIGAGASSSPVDAGDVAAGLVLATLLALDVGALALAIAGWRGNRSAAAGIAAAVLIVSYFINALAPLIDAIDSIKRVSIFYWYLEGDPLRHGLAVGDAVILAVVALVLFGAALVLFERRNLAA